MKQTKRQFQVETLKRLQLESSNFKNFQRVSKELFASEKENAEQFVKAASIRSDAIR